MKTKTFDAVEMKRRGAQAIYTATAHLSQEQQLAYWQERTRELLQKQEAQRVAATQDSPRRRGRI